MQSNQTANIKQKSEALKFVFVRDCFYIVGNLDTNLLSRNVSKTNNVGIDKRGYSYSYL